MTHIHKLEIQQKGRIPLADRQESFDDRKQNDPKLILQQTPLFQGISPSDLEALLSCLQATRKQLQKDQPIFLEGDPATHFGVVLQGRVSIIRTDYYGNTNMIHTKKAGQLFAEAFACSNVKEMPVSVYAADPSEVLLIDARRLMFPCDTGCGYHQQLVYNLLRIMSQNNVFLNQKMGIITKKTTREKLMAYLTSEAKACGSDQFEIEFDRQTLADYLGVERSAMSTELSKLAKDGYLEVKRRHFRILQTMD